MVQVSMHTCTDIADYMHSLSVASVIKHLMRFWMQGYQSPVFFYQVYQAPLLPFLRFTKLLLGLFSGLPSSSKAFSQVYQAPVVLFSRFTKHWWCFLRLAKHLRCFLESYKGDSNKAKLT